jgi:hypothetical protein
MPVRSPKSDESKRAGKDDRRDDVHADDLLPTTTSPASLPDVRADGHP